MAYPFEPDRLAAADGGDGTAEPPTRRLPIVSADERLAEPRTIKGVLLGTTGIGKTWQLKTLAEQTTLFWDLEAGDLTVQDWRGDAIRPRKWEECRDLAVFIGGPNPALRPDQPYSSAHYEEVCERYGDPAVLDRYQTVFIDSITVAGRLCLQHCRGQPEAFSERTGKPDLRGAYGLHGREMIGWLTQLQHTRGKNVWFVMILEEKLDDFNRRIYLPQIDGSKTANELPGIVDEVVTLAQIPKGILATSAEAGPVFAAGVWYYLEVEAFVHDTTGFVRVYRDGNLLVEADNQDTRGQAGSDLVELIRFIGNNGGGTSDGPNVWSIDDIYVLDDSTRLGQCRVSTLLPEADTADADWTPNSGSTHFNRVNNDDGDTSYIASDAATDLDMFGAQDLSFTPQTVHAVQISWRARKDDAATREVRSRIRSDAATADGATRTLTSSYLYYHDVFEEDPDSAGPWTGAAVAAMEIGVETVT